MKVSTQRHGFKCQHASPHDMAGALGIEPRPSVLETDVLTVEHHAPVWPGIISFPYAGCVCGRTDNTFAAPVGPDRFSCSSLSTHPGPCSPETPMYSRD